MIAFGMNGEPLPREHGFPVRMVVPGLYGFVSATQVDHQDDAHDVRRRSRPTGPSATGPRTPRSRSPAASTPPSRCRTTTRAAPSSAASRGPRASASRTSRCASTAAPGSPPTLGPDAGNDYWRQWYLEWDAEPGQHFVASRATNKDGDVQTAARMRPLPRGLERHPGDRRQRRLTRVDARLSAPSHPRSRLGLLISAPASGHIQFFS